MHLNAVRKWSAAVATAAFLAAAPATAGAAERAPDVDLSSVVAQRPVADVVFPPGRSTRALAAQPTRSESWVDDRGIPISISTSLADVDLAPFAGVFAAILHGPELAQLRVNAVQLAEIPGICGNPQAVACYRARSEEHT